MYKNRIQFLIFAVEKMEFLETSSIFKHDMFKIDKIFHSNNKIYQCLKFFLLRTVKYFMIILKAY